MVLRRVLKPAVFILALVPAALLVRGMLRGDLGINPAETIQLETGRWTFKFLLLTLAVTPVRRLTGWNPVIQFRRMLGLFAFFYGTLHLTTYVWLDKFFDWQEILKDVAKRRYITAGFSAFVLMIPLAVTSTAWAIRRLGGPRWRRLHQLIYVSAIAGVIHYYWLVKSDVRLPLMYAAIVAVLLVYRFVV